MVPAPALPTLAAAWCVALAVLAGACRDTTSCATFDDCSDHAMLLRTGHLCRGFPWYQGHEPLRNGLQWTLGRRWGVRVAVWVRVRVQCCRLGGGMGRLGPSQ